MNDRIKLKQFAEQAGFLTFAGPDIHAPLSAYGDGCATLYHITPVENLQSIREQGLIPAFRNGLTCGPRKYVKPVIWLTDDPVYILSKQAGERWVKIYNPVVLKVHIDGLDVKPYISHHTGTPTVVPHEYYIENTIKQHFVVEL